MRTIREVVGSVRSMLSQTGDDAKISKVQLTLWATWFINKYIYLHQAKIDTGSYITILPELSVQSSSVTTSPNIVKARKYSVMPQQIFDLDKDMGIAYITYPYDFILDSHMHLQDIQFQRIAIGKIDQLKRNPYDTPGPDNPFFFVYGKQIGYLGIDDILVSKLEMAIRTPFDPFTEHSLDDEIPILVMFGADIAKNVYEMGRYELLMPKDRINDAAATQDPSDVSNTRAVSINENNENNE